MPHREELLFAGSRSLSFPERHEGVEGRSVLLPLQSPSQEARNHVAVTLTEQNRCRGLCGKSELADRDGGTAHRRPPRSPGLCCGLLSALVKGICQLPKQGQDRSSPLTVWSQDTEWGLPPSVLSLGVPWPPARLLTEVTKVKDLTFKVDKEVRRGIEERK